MPFMARNKIEFVKFHLPLKYLPGPFLVNALPQKTRHGMRVAFIDAQFLGNLCVR